jgi:hypothetical protein
MNAGHISVELANLTNSRKPKHAVNICITEHSGTLVKSGYNQEQTDHLLQIKMCCQYLGHRAIMNAGHICVKPGTK